MIRGYGTKRSEEYLDESLDRITLKAKRLGAKYGYDVEISNGDLYIIKIERK